MIDLQPLPMKEAQQFWRDKVPMSPSHFRALSDEAKTRAFAVSGIAKGDELTTIMQSIQKGLDSGIPYHDFKNECSGMLARLGWSGAKINYRLDNIFRTNIQTAYSVGRYKQMQEVRETRPYWQYSAVNDSRTRPTHAALNGKIFPADSPFWDIWYPPNGFRCRCGVVTLSADNVRDEKLRVEKDDPTGKLIEPRDPVTGNKMPARLLMPDQGFANNPGKTVWGGIVDAQTKPGKWETLPGLKTASLMGLARIQDVPPETLPKMPAQPLPAGEPDDFYKDEFIKRYGEETVLTDPVSDPVIISLRAFMRNKEAETFKFDQKGHGESIPLVGYMIVDPFEIWLAAQRNKESGQIRLTKRYFSLWHDQDKNVGGFAVFEVSGGIFQGVSSFLPKNKKGAPDFTYLEKQREGLLLYKKKK
jgi:SPP1 gp7 family putative phage head morphogenesis protein